MYEIGVATPATAEEEMEAPFMNKIIATATAALLALGLSGVGRASAAGLYSGRWPVTISQSQHSNGARCLILTDDGSFRFPHSGAADMAGTENGVFQVIGHTILVSLEYPGSGEEVATWVFTAHAAAGMLGAGVWGYVQGEPADSGKAVFGEKGGC